MNNLSLQISALPAEGVFTTTKDMDEIVLRFGQAGRLCLSGARYAGKYIDWTHACLLYTSTTGDLLLQTEITLENIQHLIGLEEGRENLPEHSGKLGLLRAYLKNEEDAPAVKVDLDKLCPDLPIAYLYADCLLYTSRCV